MDQFQTESESTDRTKQS